MVTRHRPAMALRQPVYSRRRIARRPRARHARLRWLRHRPRQRRRSPRQRRRPVAPRRPKLRCTAMPRVARAASGGCRQWHWPPRSRWWSVSACAGRQLRRSRPRPTRTSQRRLQRKSKPKPTPEQRRRRPAAISLRRASACPRHQTRGMLLSACPNLRPPRCLHRRRCLHPQRLRNPPRCLHALRAQRPSASRPHRLPRLLPRPCRLHRHLQLHWRRQRCPHRQRRSPAPRSSRGSLQLPTVSRLRR